MPIEPRISLITLGVDDLATSTGFYVRLGWRLSKTASTDAVSFFALANVVLGLFSRKDLADDAGLEDRGPGFSGVTLAQNVASEAAVDEVLATAVAAGGTLLKGGRKVFWGGYTGYFGDPSGHAWEVAFNPFFPLDPQGNIVLPE